MKVSQVYPGRWLKPVDLGRKAVRKKIARIEYQEVGRDRETMPIAAFEDGSKPWIINSRNARFLGEHLGDDMDGWGGSVVELYSVTVEVGGKTIETIRARLPKHITRAQAPADVLFDDDVPADDGEAR
jgi:hypothetical protein